MPVSQIVLRPEGAPAGNLLDKITVFAREVPSIRYTGRMILPDVSILDCPRHYDTAQLRSCTVTAAQPKIHPETVSAIA
jgi:hypothetical protein